MRLDSKVTNRVYELHLVKESFHVLVFLLIVGLSFSLNIANLAVSR